MFSVHTYCILSFQLEDQIHILLHTRIFSSSCSFWHSLTFANAPCQIVCVKKTKCNKQFPKFLQDSLVPNKIKDAPCISKLNLRKKFRMLKIKLTDRYMNKTFLYHDTKLRLLFYKFLTSRKYGDKKYYGKNCMYVVLSPKSPGQLKKNTETNHSAYSNHLL